MHFKFFTIPVQTPDKMEAELNRFLASHAVLNIERQFVTDGQNSFWTLCISYQAGAESEGEKAANKVDYKEVLNEHDFAIYVRLRDLRKQLAEKDGVPAYALFTNKQLASMIENKITTLAALKQIAGVGDARAEKYGEAFLRILRAELKTKSDEKT